MIKTNPLGSVMIFALIASFSSNSAFGQADQKTDDPLLKIYREAAPKINDLIHTKLAVRFDYKKCYLYGQEWVTLKPHMYPTDTLRLDAKGMEIKELSIIKDGQHLPLKYSYDDSLSLAIHLDKEYRENEKYTIYINYTAKPNDLKLKGSAAINDAKGLYFINPDSSEKDKPVQIWTQGETESNSAWFPTIDKPNQKTTDEISMTVPAKYVTLSNGRLVSQKNNGDNTRTDTWVMDLPHSPYLFMMAVGDFRIYHDKWHDKEVDYYLEPKYAPYARDIFGETPEMLEFYWKLLGVDYVWNKYSQVVVRDYVSGSMENTTATLHGAQVQETPRELIDANYDFARQSIAHEIFHQWFGDLVTCESWSNLTVNESFADFSEVLWAEHRYGQDEGDAHRYDLMQGYLNNRGGSTVNLVRYHYDDREDVFDAVSYNKGGCILAMLRNYLGNDAFFKGLNIYLKANEFKAAEAQQLRIAEEEASGLDLNWFFNQWYYGAGHPVLNIDYNWDDALKTETVYLKQTQEGQIFKLPFAVDIYINGKKERHKVWMNDKADTLIFKAASKPDLVNVDGDKILLCSKTDNKTMEEYAYQYFNAGRYLDRYEAITAASRHTTDKTAQKILIAALKDKYYGLNIKAIQALDMGNSEIHDAALPILVSLAQNAENSLVRAAAITALGKLKSPGYMDIFKPALNSQSYAIQGAALGAIDLLDSKQAFTIAKGFEADNKTPLTDAMVISFAKDGSDDEWRFICNTFINKNPNVQYRMLESVAAILQRLNQPGNVQQGIALLKDFGVKYKSFGIGPMIIDLLQGVKASRVKANDAESATMVEDAMKAINNAKQQ
jgi:aminopeptidase N